MISGIITRKYPNTQIIGSSLHQLDDILSCVLQNDALIHEIQDKFNLMIIVYFLNCIPKSLLGYVLIMINFILKMFHPKKKRCCTFARGLKYSPNDRETTKNRETLCVWVYILIKMIMFLEYLKNIDLGHLL